MLGRIRNIKPEFFDDPDIGELSPFARLLFIGLWTQADKAGRLIDDPRRLKARLFPYDAVDVDALLVELHGRNMVRRYRAVEPNGKLGYLWIPKFSKHQRPHPKEAESLIPPWTKETEAPPGNAVERNGRNAGIFGSLDPGSLGSGSGNRNRDKAAAPPAAAVAVVNHDSATNEAKNDDGRPSLLVGERVEAPRSKKPVFMGARFSLFEWQLRELEAMVGTDAFDVLGFLFELDSRHAGNGQVIPRDGVWAWLQQQVLGEARRRGMVEMPMASDLSKNSVRMLNSIARIEADERAALLALEKGGDA